MTDEPRSLLALKARFKRIEASRMLTAKILADAEDLLGTNHAIRWPWLTAGALAIIAGALVLPYFGPGEPGAPAKPTLKVPSLSVTYGHIPASADVSVPALISLGTLPLVPTRRPEPTETKRTDDSSQSSESNRNRKFQDSVVALTEVSDHAKI